MITSNSNNKKPNSKAYITHIHARTHARARARLAPLSVDMYVLLLVVVRWNGNIEMFLLLTVFNLAVGCVVSSTWVQLLIDDLVRINTQTRSLCTLYLLTFKVRVTVDDSGLCCCCVCDVFRELINSLMC